MNIKILLTLIAVALLPLTALAESWCAVPLHAHEWGVQVFDGDGATIQMTPDLPGFFHSSPPAQRTPSTNVRDLPPDSGIRALPVLHFYGEQGMGDPRIPVGIEVGFKHGDASVWFPQVDGHVPAAVANSTVAKATRDALRADRAKRQPRNLHHLNLPADPTRQLVWDRLELTSKPLNTPLPPEVPWVDALRSVDDALWVNRDAESERFVFYEANTRERPALRVTRATDWSKARPQYVLHNDGAHPVHDVFVIKREADARHLFYAPTLAAKGQAVFELTADVSDAAFKKATHETLRSQLITPPKDRTFKGFCEEDPRDPAIPVEVTSGSKLFEAEADALLQIWSPRFFERDGTTIVYREDIGYLDEVMPLSIYTDMYRFVELSRTGLVVWQNLDLQALSQP